MRVNINSAENDYGVKTAELTKIVIDRDTLSRYNEYYFSQHKRAKKVPIKNPYHESINTWMILRRPAMNALKQRWKTFIMWLADDAGISGINIKRCIISHRVYYPTNARHDNDNSVPKFILDGLVESGVIVDDDIKCVKELRLKCFVDKDNPRTEINIYSY